MKKFLQFVFSKLPHWFGSLSEIISEIIDSFRALFPAKKPKEPEPLSPLKAFVKKYTGVAVDFDGHFGELSLDFAYH